MAVSQSNDGNMGADTRADAEKPPDKRPRGFAGLSDEEKRRISTLGGKTAHARGHAHKFSLQEASAGGQKGGRAISKDRSYMSKIGRRGGLAHRREEEPDDEPRTDAGAGKASAPPPRTSPLQIEIAPPRGRYFIGQKPPRTLPDSYENHAKR